MAWLRRVFRLPAHESNIGLVLIFCVISMSFMSIALVWQAQIIANQREAQDPVGVRIVWVHCYHASQLSNGLVIPVTFLFSVCI